MKFTILFGSPRGDGNTAALLAPFLDECAALGVETERIDLYGRDLAPCRGCMACQDDPELGCVQADGFQAVFRAMGDCNAMIFATPIYAWYCTAPMKALMDRAIYAGTKNYGAARGVRLLEGGNAASICTCGYPPDRGADLWTEGLRRWCCHGGLNYLGALCRRDLGRDVPFMDAEREEAARDFARALRLSLQEGAL